MPAITDQDGNVAQVTPSGALVVTGSGVAAPPVALRIVDAEGDEVLVTDGGELKVTGDDFARILKFEPKAGEEIRRDETTTDDYHGVAPDGSATSSAVWSVVRFYKSSGLITRVRYRTGVAWDSRTAGW